MAESVREIMLRHLKELTGEMNIPSYILRKQEEIIDDLLNYQKVKNIWS